jgi:hypothetical protein
VRPWLAFLAALGLTVLVATPGSAHGFAPIVLELRERGGGLWDSELRSTVEREAALPELVLPADCTRVSADETHVRLRCPTLRGEALATRGLDGHTELLVEVHFLDGTTASGSIHRDGERFSVPTVKASTADIGGWIGVGARHILGGLDHLLFVTALFFLVRTRRSLVLSLTAFTVAHSVTLALGALGLVRLPPLLAEALIALSIMFLAAELARSGPRRTLTARRPWLVAFAFGLLHGAGFASGLEEAGFERAHVVRALFGFNVGVELGQLAFVVVLALSVAALRRAPLAGLLTRPRLVGYASGALAAAWTFERAGAMFR